MIFAYEPASSVLPTLIAKNGRDEYSEQNTLAFAYLPEQRLVRLVHFLMIIRGATKVSYDRRQPSHILLAFY